MHQEAKSFVLGAVAVLPRRRFVVEFGSHNVNGTCRDFVPADGWHGIDIWPGPGVDEVANAADWTPSDDIDADTVLSMECLEHAPEAREICANAKKILRDGGVFIVTCAGPGRAPHSAGGLPYVPTGEFYRNVSRESLASWLADAGFKNVYVVYSNDAGTDLYAVAS